jgi:hypothetical protein
MPRSPTAECLKTCIDAHMMEDKINVSHKFIGFAHVFNCVYVRIYSYERRGFPSSQSQLNSTSTLIHLEVGDGGEVDVSFQLGHLLICIKPQVLS